LNYSAPSVSSPKNDITELPPLPETLTNIAVVDFNGNNISDGEVRALTDRLRVELFKTKYFKVIEREMMEEVLKEQGFQQSGCSTDECMVQIGRLIGVQKIIGGSISKVGNIYSVSSRIVNVETGEIEKTEVYDHIGEIGQLLTNGMREVAIGLLK
jgi:curli biogenesis system outer membrane secretion channel CsgG